MNLRFQSLTSQASIFASLADRSRLIAFDVSLSACFTSTQRVRPAIKRLSFAVPFALHFSVQYEKLDMLMMVLPYIRTESTMMRGGVWRGVIRNDLPADRHQLQRCGGNGVNCIELEPQGISRYQQKI